MILVILNKFFYINIYDKFKERMQNLFSKRFKILSVRLHILLRWSSRNRIMYRGTDGARRDAFSNWASPGQYSRLRVSQSCEHLAFSNNGRTPATSRLVSLRSIFRFDVYPIETSARSRAGFSGRWGTQFSSGNPLAAALWPDWHVRDCASRWEARKEGRKGAEWGDFTGFHSWVRLRGERQRRPRLAARCNYNM